MTLENQKSRHPKEEDACHDEMKICERDALHQMYQQVLTCYDLYLLQIRISV